MEQTHTSNESKRLLHFIPIHMAQTIEDAQLIAPTWTVHINQVDDGWMCLDKVPPPCIWDGVA